MVETLTLLEDTRQKKAMRLDANHAIALTDPSRLREPIDTNTDSQE